MQGIIAAGHAQTAEAGAEIVRQGGNAVDAAVAATFASFITESALVNIGGGGIAQIYNPISGRAVGYDFFSTMPGLSHNGHSSVSTIDFRKVLVDFGSAQQPFYIGRGSVAVPGVVAGLCTMVEEMGTLPLPTILAPTIRMAREGVVLSDAQAYIANILAPILTDTPEIAAIYTATGQIVAGQPLYFTALADTLERLGQEGASLFYTGSVAQKIITDQQTQGGLLTELDLASYRVRRVEPISINYRSYTILLPPPFSSGGMLIAFVLKLLATLSLSNLSHNSAEHLQILAEVMRLTNIARAERKESPHQRTGYSPAQAHKRVADLLAETNIQRYHQELKRLLTTQEKISEPILPHEPANTTHVSVADADGMIVSVTTSSGENAGFVVGDTGVMLNNMLGEVDLHPNGFHRLPPGQRMMTMMSPTLVLRQGQPVLAVGSGGSNRLRSAILQVISNIIDFELPPAEAVDASRVHFEAGELQLEGGIAPQVADQLEEAGYMVNRWPARNMFFGGTHAVARANKHDTDSAWVAAGDSRRGGAVAVIE
jgi:gamma-glutamyltranspeptidase/glutathione hydrolase